MRELLNAHRGTVGAQRYLDLRAGAWASKPIMAEVNRTGPDVIFSTVVGQATAYLYQAYADAGIDPDDMPIASLTTCEAEGSLMGADVGPGHLIAASYFQQVRSPDNDAF